MSLRNLPNAISMEFLQNEGISKSLTTWQKVKYIATHITVEPLIFFYILPGTMGLLSSQNLYLEKACLVNLKYNTSVCDAMVRRDPIGYEKYQEDEVQRLVSKMLSFKTAIVGFFPTILLIFFGSWSDRHSRRKPVILTPIICDIFTTTQVMLCAIFFMEVPLEYVLIADTLPYAFAGGWCCVFLGVFSFVSGISSDKDRTIRIGALSMFQNVAMAIGNVMGGLLIQPLGLPGSFAFVAFIMSCALTYGVFMIKEDKKISKEVTQHKHFLKDFFDIKHVKTTFEICFKGGPNSTKWRRIVIMIATALIIGPLQGELAVVYLYTRIKFGWSEVDFTIYNTVQFFIQTAGSIFALTYFSKKLKIDDAMLGIIALFSKISACLIYAFAPSGHFFFLGSIAEVFHGTCHIALRSLMAKIVPPHELGQSNSVFGVCEALMPLVFGPMYSILYNRTLGVFPGGFYLISAVLYFITLPLFFWLYKSSKKDKKIALEKAKDAEQEQELLQKNNLSSQRKSVDITNK
ncbi:hypothetical protein WA026_013446 [Henosepilachna vigintioctopunctata]|uniref:Solute carrier family 46 member 3 n=1 Tax=Henosepilachna vigintioctopunctata TaxID=420089 RepID=A0AAW1V7K9_9CUCU